MTIVPRKGDGFRLVCNRDERRTRPPALAPRAHRLRRLTATFPVDPLAGGTWIGVNARGLAMAILNRNVAADGHRALSGPLRTSRSTIIPALLDYGTLEEALAVGRTLAPSRFAPFRLVAVQGSRVSAIVSDGRALSSNHWAIDRPLLFTSSSLGDALVDAPRRRAFAGLVLQSRDAWLGGQALFHRARSPEQPELGVVMCRQDAATVSRTVVDVDGEAIAVEYEPIPLRDHSVPPRSSSEAVAAVVT
ncbi:MAG: NRDE family protein [Acidobacteriota bacterium]